MFSSFSKCPERRPNRLRSRAIGALAGAAALLVVAACGGSEGSDGGDVGTAKGSPVRVAVMSNESGPSLSGGELSKPVLQAWAKSVNGKGGVAGHPVEFVFNDLKGDPSTATATAAKVAADKSIVAAILFDPFTEGVYAPAFSKAGIPVIGGIGVSPLVWGKEPNFLALATTFPSVINAPFVAAEKVGSTRTATVVCAEYPTCAGIGDIAKAATEKLGLAYGGTIKVSLTAADYTAPCLKIQQDKIDFVMLSLDMRTNMRIVAACKTQGYEGKWGLTGAVDPAVMIKHEQGVPIETALVAFPWWVDDAPVKAYRDVMDKQGVSETTWANPNSTAAYATAELLRKTLDESASALAETLTRADIIKAYATIKDETLEGLLPAPISFEANKPEKNVACYWLSTYSNGKFSGTKLTQPTCDAA